MEGLINVFWNKFLAKLEFRILEIFIDLPFHKIKSSQLFTQVPMEATVPHINSKTRKIKKFMCLDIYQTLKNLERVQNMRMKLALTLGYYINIKD